MSGNRRRLFYVTALAFGVSCFHSTAPPGFLPTATEAATSPYGGWIKVDMADGSIVQGELLAATSDTLHVFTLAQWTAIPIARVRSTTLAGYQVPLGPNTTWTALGAVSTASHGGFLILTAPLWIITGTTGTSSASKAPRVVSIDPEALRLYARFPQGLPEGLDRASIRPKP